MKNNTTFGNAWMHRTLVASLRYVDVRALYAFVSIFVMPICLLLNTNHSRTTAYHYFRRHQGYGRWHSAWATYINHCLFGQVVIDRFATFAGKRFDVKVEGRYHFDHLASQEEGFMILSSHVGCYEIAGYSLMTPHKRLNALVYGGEKAEVMQGRAERFSHNNVNMIPVMPDMSHLFLVNDALANHEIVSMPADRALGSSKRLTINLLDASAPLPMGPFSVATMRGLDVLAVNVLKTSAKQYTAYVTPLSYDKSASRKEQMQQLADGYAHELEHILKQYSTQWYNFFEFWS